MRDIRDIKNISNLQKGFHCEETMSTSRWDLLLLDNDKTLISEESKRRGISEGYGSKDSMQP